jgi:hypothetical protein
MYLLCCTVTSAVCFKSQTRDPRASKLVRCCMYDVRRVLGINSGGDAALMAVAHLAGGDYDMGGAENVGEALALGAVRQLLAGSEVNWWLLMQCSPIWCGAPCGALGGPSSFPSYVAGDEIEIDMVLGWLCSQYSVFLVCQAGSRPL